MKYLALVVFLLSLWGCQNDQTAPPPQQPQKPVQTSETFRKKEYCAGKLEILQENAERGRFKMEAYSRTFYSPSRDSCIALKYVLYFAHGTVPEKESLEIDDLSNNETVWYQSVPCGMKSVGALYGHPDETKYTCTEYAWDAEAELEQYVRSNKLE